MILVRTMKHFSIVLSLLIFLLSCKKDSNNKNIDNESRQKLYGVWESTQIKSYEKQPPKKVTFVFNYIKNTPYTVLEMKVEGESNQIIQRKTNVSITTRQIRPYTPDGEELTRRDQRLKLENGKTASNLIWDYELIGNRLIVHSGPNKITLQKSRISVKEFYENHAKQKELFKPK